MGNAPSENERYGRCCGRTEQVQAGSKAELSGCEGEDEIIRKEVTDVRRLSKTQSTRASMRLSVGAADAAADPSKFPSDNQATEGGSRCNLQDLEDLAWEAADIQRELEGEERENQERSKEHGPRISLRRSTLTTRLDRIGRRHSHVMTAISPEQEAALHGHPMTPVESPVHSGSEQDLERDKPPGVPARESRSAVRERKHVQKRSHSLPQKANILKGMERTVATRQQRIIENHRFVTDVYKIDNARVLGKGSFGSVRKAFVKSTGALRAIKFIVKEKCDAKMMMVRSEVTITKMVDHPYIIELYEIFEDPKNIILAMELCTGGTLMKRAFSGGVLPEATVATCMRQIMVGVNYLHENNICHRDIKPQNVLVSSRASLDRATLKITDFGLSCVFTPGVVLKARVGTPVYMGPEVYLRKYDERCDIWSCGIVLFRLLTGLLPFVGADSVSTERQICKGISYDVFRGVSVSSLALDLIQGLLTKRLAHRLPMSYALRHEWFQKLAPQKTVALPPDIIDNLLYFRTLNRFKKAALHVIVGTLSESQRRRSKQIFLFLDTDSDGVLSLKDLTNRLGEEAVRPLRESTANSGAPDGDRQADFYYTEFLAATFDRSYIEESVCRAAFAAFDQDGDGHITAAELADEGSPLGHMSPSELQSLVVDFDQDNDGTIDVDEFLQMLRSLRPQAVLGQRRSSAPLLLKQRTEESMGSLASK